jgi:hypothetical protein
MPTHIIQVSEYECGHCGWKWISRINGKDRPVPLKCAKCKRPNWNYPAEDTLGYTERGLRARLQNLEPDETSPKYMRRNIQEPNELCKKFFNLKPRPTEKELAQALYPYGYDIHGRNVNHIRQDPQDPSSMIFNHEEWLKLQEQEPEKRRQFMQQVIDSRAPAV